MLFPRQLVIEFTGEFKLIVILTILFVIFISGEYVASEDLAQNKVVSLLRPRIDEHVLLLHHGQLTQHSYKEPKADNQM